MRQPQSEPISKATVPGQHICSVFNLGKLLAVERAGGTRNRNFFFRTNKGRWHVRQRHPDYCDPKRISFDHRIVRFFYGKSVPVTPPMPSSNGNTCWQNGVELWEVYPFVEGRHLHDGDTADIYTLALSLAKLHQAGNSCKLRYQKIGPMGEAEPKRLLANIKKIQNDNPETAVSLLPYRKMLKTASEELTRTSYLDLPHTIIHGDIQPGNILVNNGLIAAFVDLDWCAWRPRLYDLCFAIIFCCAGHDQPIGDSDIWLLTQTPQLDAVKIKNFLHNYCLNSTPLSPAEKQAFVPLLKLIWCHTRIDGTLKVAGPKRAIFLAREHGFCGI